MLTEAQKRAQAKYNKANVRQTAVRFYPSERDMWEWLETRGNKAGYIKSLIRADMERGGGRDA